MDNNTNNLIPSLADCLKAAAETQELLIKKDVYQQIPVALNKYFKYAAVCIAADEHTWAVAGDNIRKVLEGSGIKVAGVHIFPGEPRLHAEYTHVETLKNWISSFSEGQNLVPIAVGAGTVNDLVKRASFECKLPYLCAPTAASVDGYTANGAALLLDGFKQTLPCDAPRVLAADPEILAQAPAYLSSSGFGDLASKIIAGTDWIIAEKAGSHGAPGTNPIDPTAWAMTQNGLLDALHRSANAAKGDSDAVSALFTALAITGFAMQRLKNSRPVSGSEHLFSHVWEMEDLSLNGVPVTHGHKVSIGTLAATAFTELFFADPKGPPQAPRGFQRPSPAERKEEVSAAFKGSRAHDGIVAMALEKLMDNKTAETINAAFRDSWKDIRERVLAKLLPYGELRALMEKALCPLRPETINLKRTEAIATARRAQMMRNKYGILDLAWDMGVLEDILARIESSDVYLR
jgi:glycerol-1-phosphate dehydrogenase [NAD(P)+]